VSVYARPYNERDGSEIVEYDGFNVEYRDASHRYWIHIGDARYDVPSVTTALDVLGKPALLSWAEACGVEGALILERQGELKDVDPKSAIDYVRLHGVGKDRKRDAGADRGTAIHDALRAYVELGVVPSVDDYPAETRGYVQGLCAWLLNANPAPVLSEQIVGSPVHGFAGRLDLICELRHTDGFQGRTLVDLKTNPKASVYAEAHLQVSAYALCLPECGIDPPERTLIVGVGAEGQFKEVPGFAEREDFLPILKTAQIMRRLVSQVRSWGIESAL